MLPSEAISKLLGETFEAVEEWARESKKNLNDAHDDNVDEAQASNSETEPSDTKPNPDPFVEFIGAFKDAEQQMLRIQSATLRATQAFVETLKTELESVGSSADTTADSDEESL